MREGCGSGVHVDVHFVAVRVLGGCGGEFKKCRMRLFVFKWCIWMNWCVFVSKGFVGGEYVRFIMVCVGYENSMNYDMRSDSKSALQFFSVSRTG